MLLTKKELEVAKLFALGASDKEAALELSLSPETTHTYRKNILRKINGHNVADLTRWYFQYAHKISFGMNPRQIRHIAMIMLALVMYAEFSRLPVIRIRNASRARNEQSAPSPVRIRASRCRILRRSDFIPAVA